jgi:heme ABC exporter ATP-binding subunit CcmA
MTERPVEPTDPPSSTTRATDALLSLADLRRRFGSRTVLDGISIAVRPGEIHLVVGPNGSGKSTLLRIAAGLLRAHGGEVRVSGTDPRGAPGVRRGIGFVGHQSGLYDDLTPLENLSFAGRLFGLSDAGRVAKEWLDRVGVGSDRNVPVRRLSRGTVQRVAIARSLLHGPRLLIWDEPLTGLDGLSVERVIDTLTAAQAAGGGALVVSHDLDPLWRLTARVHVLHRGGVRLAVDTGVELNEFRRRYAEQLDG